MGLPAEKATPFVVVGGIVILQWLILIIKPALERWVYFDERDQVIRIQELRDRILTTRDLRHFLEKVLAAVCEILQVETAFVASVTPDGRPKVELIIGPLSASTEEPPPAGLDALRLDSQLNGPAGGGRFTWNGYWILPLHDRKGETILGIMGAHVPKDLPPLTKEQDTALIHLARQASAALEDRLLQQEVFAAMEGLLEQAEASDRRRQVSALPIQPGKEDLVQRKEFAEIVRDALSHYWGGPKLTESPLLQLRIVRQSELDHQGSSLNAMRAVLLEAIESLRPEGKRSMTTTEWILYNILELKFVKGLKVRDVARRLAMSESDLYRKQRIAIEAAARSIVGMEQAAQAQGAPIPGWETVIEKGHQLDAQQKE